MAAQEDWTNLVEALANESLKAKEMISELRSELKEARRVIKEMKEERDKAVARAIEEAIAEAVQVGLAEYSETITHAMDQAVDKVNREFEELKNLFMTGKPSGKGQNLKDLFPRG